MSHRPTDAVRVARVRVDALAAEVAGIALSFGPMRKRSLLLITVETDDGLCGHGESWVNYPSWAPTERRATVLDGVAPLVIGADARDVRAIHRRVSAALAPIARQWGAPGPITQAISGVDMALWDLLGKATGRSVAELLITETPATGTHKPLLRRRIPVYASGLGPTGVAEDAADCAAAGFRAAKLRVGFGVDVDTANLHAARGALGDDVVLLADANQAWTLDEAIAMAPALRDAGVCIIEEPMAGNPLAALEELAKHTGLRIALGENVYGTEAMLPYLHSPAVGLVQPDVSKTGGISCAVEIARQAAECATTICPHLYGGAVAYAATLQLAACCPTLGAVEYDVRANPLRDPLLIDPPLPVDGDVDLPTGPGLGVELNMDAVRLVMT